MVAAEPLVDDHEASPPLLSQCDDLGLAAVQVGEELGTAGILERYGLDPGGRGQLGRARPLLAARLELRSNGRRDHHLPVESLEEIETTR